MSEELHVRVGLLEGRIGTLESSHERHGELIQRLDDDIAEIRERLGKTATKDDIIGLRAHIDQSINGLLRDALHAVPARQMVWWTAGSVIVAVAGYIGVHGIH